MASINVTCIGGGHGLGHLLATLNGIENINLSGIVCTTDNGGSTGRLRNNAETISWGDIRYCLSKLAPKESIKSLLFEHRFQNLGDLSGHSLGNLMFCAIDSLCIRPTDSVKVMSEFLDIKATVLPMSDSVTNLVSHDSASQCHFGEVNVDKNSVSGIEKLLLSPPIEPSVEVLETLNNSDILFLGPGSFYTSIIPNLLMRSLVKAINRNEELIVYFLVNVNPEFNCQQDELTYQLEFLKAVGIKKTIHSIVPEHRTFKSLEQCWPYSLVQMPADKSGRHLVSAFKKTLLKIIYS